MNIISFIKNNSDNLNKIKECNTLFVKQGKTILIEKVGTNQVVPTAPSPPSAAVAVEATATKCHKGIFQR